MYKMAEWDNYEIEAASTKSQAEQERAAFMLVATLGLSPYRDGNQWCFLWGENLQEGVAGFGDTVRSAAEDFSMNCHNERLNPKPSSKSPSDAIEDVRNDLRKIIE